MAGNHMKIYSLQCQRMSALHRQRALERRRQRYRERRANETTAEKERRLQSERERQRQRLLGERGKVCRKTGILLTLLAERLKATSQTQGKMIS